MSDGEAREGARGRPKERIETGEMRAVGREDGGVQKGKVSPEKGRTAGRNLTIFKSLVLTVLVVITFYGMLNRGLVGVERWLPVATAILGLVFITLFVADYFAAVPGVAWARAAAARRVPVAAAVLGLVFIALFGADYFAGVPGMAGVLVGLLVVLVAVKG